MADDDIIVRLKAQANTDEMKRFVADLQKLHASIIQQGASQATAQSVVQRHYNLTIQQAQRLGGTLQQHLTIIGQLTAAQQKQAQAAQRAAQQQQQAMQQQQRAARSMEDALGNLVRRYLSIGAAAEGVRRSFMRWGDVDQQFRRLQNQAGSSRAEVDALGSTFSNMARVSGQGLDEIIKGFDTLREKADLSLSQTKDLFPTIVQGAEAAGTTVTEMSTAFASLMNNMKISAPQAGTIMNQMATAAKDLGLNINEMVGAMPQLTEVFGAWGYTGVRGHAHMLAWVSALKNVTGGTGAAANAMSRMLEQASGPRMAAALRMPQDMLQRLMEAARDQGKDVMSVVAERLIQQAKDTGRSTDQLLSGFSLRERRYWRVIINNLEETKRKAQAVWEGSDTAAVRAALNMRTGPGAEIKRLAAAWDQLLLSFGKTLDKVGVTSALQELAEELEAVGEAMELISKGEWRKGLEKLGVGFGEEGKKAIEELERQKQQRRMMRPGSGGFDQSFEKLFRQQESDPARDQDFRNRLKSHGSYYGPSSGMAPPGSVPGYTADPYSGLTPRATLPGGKPILVPERTLPAAPWMTPGEGQPNIRLRGMEPMRFMGGAKSSWEDLPDTGENYIEDRRGEHQQVDATQRLVYVMERIALLLEDFVNVQTGGEGGRAGGGRVGFMSGGGGGGGGLGRGAGRIGAGGGGVGGGGGVAGGGAGGVAGGGGGGGGVSDPMGGGGGAPGWQLDTPGGGEGGTASGGKGSDIYNKFKAAYEKSGLVGTIPPGGEKFGFKTGSADEWARFGTAVANAESSFNPNASNPSDPGGSHGILQYAHGQVPGGNARNVDASIDAFVRDSKTSVESGHGLGAGGLLGRRFSTIGKHPERTARKLGKDIGKLSGGSGGPPGGVDPISGLPTGRATGSTRTAGGPVDFGSDKLVPEMTEGMVQGAAGTNVPGGQTTVVTAPVSGHKFRVASQYAENFQGFVNDYEAAGGRVGPDSGGLANRFGNPSYHPRGMAIDLNQVGYGVRSKKGQTLPKEQEDALAGKWGLYPGSQFKRRSDIGHFEVRNRKAAEAAVARQREAAQKRGQSPVATPKPDEGPAPAPTGYDRLLGGPRRGRPKESSQGFDESGFDTPKEEAPPPRLGSRRGLDAGKVNMAGDLQEARSSRGDRIARSVFRRASEGAGADIGVA